MKKHVIVCDRCGFTTENEAVVQAVKILGFGRHRVLDLCETCYSGAGQEPRREVVTVGDRDDRRRIEILDEQLTKALAEISRVKRLASEGYRGDLEPVPALLAILGDTRPQEVDDARLP